MKRNVAFGSGFALLGVLLLWKGMAHFGGPAEEIAMHEGSLKSARAMGALCERPSPTAMGLETGKAYSYSYHRTVDASWGGRKLESLTLEGKLLVQVVQSTQLEGKSGWDIVFSPLIFRFKSKQGDPDSIRAFVKFVNNKQNRFATSARARVDSHGRVYTLAVSPDDGNQSSALAKNISRDLALSWAFSLPKGGGAETVHGRDATGEYTAESGFSEQLCAFTSRKSAYVSAGKVTPRITASSHALWVSPGRIPLLVEGRDAIVTEGTTPVSGESAYSFQLLESHPTVLARSDLGRFDSSEQSRGPASTESGAGRAWSEIAQELGTGDMKQGSRIQALGDLVAALKERPELIKEAVKLALKTPSRTDGFRIIVGGISSVETAASEKALVQLYQSSQLDMHGKETVLNAFALTQGPVSNETRDFLQKTFAADPSSPLGQSAGYALASAARYSHDSASIALLQRNWEGAQTEPQMREAIRMIGNAGSPEFFGVLKPLVENAPGVPADVHEAAVYSMRFIQQPEVNGLLANALQHDTSVEGREAALAAILARSDLSSFGSQLLDCAAAGASSSLRMGCVKALLRNPEVFPAQVGALKSSYASRTIVYSDVAEYLSSQPGFQPEKAGAK